MVWKTALIGIGHSSPIVTHDAVYVTAAWNAEPNPRVLTVFRCLLWVLMLFVAAPTCGLILKRCLPDDGHPTGIRALFGLAAMGLLVVILAGLIFYGEGVLDFNRAVERPWIAACLCGTFCLIVSSLYTVHPRRAALAGGLSLLAFAGVLALTIPDRAHTVSENPLSDVSKMIYLVIALPALMGVSRFFWGLSTVYREKSAVSQQSPSQHSYRFVLAAQAIGLLLIMGAILYLGYLAAASGENIDRTVSVGTPYVPHLPEWLPLVALPMLVCCLMVRRRFGATFWWSAGAVLTTMVTMLLGLLIGAEQLVARVPYLTYLIGEPKFTPILDNSSVVLFAVAIIVIPIAMLLRVLSRRSAPLPTLPVITRIAAFLLVPLYFVYAIALPRVPRLERGIVCLNRKTGEIRWQRGGVAAPGSVLHSDNSPATPTPVTDDERIYAYFGTPGLLCADHRGKRLWVNTELPYSTREGVASSPILCQGKVIILSESDAGGYLAAVDGKTGKTVWKTQRDKKRHSFAGNCRTPTVVSIAGREVILVWGYEDVSGYAPEIGRMLWSQKVEDTGTGGNPVASAVTDGNRLFLVGPYEAICLDIARLAQPGKFLLWRQETDEGAQCSTPVITNGLLFAVSDNGAAYCLDTASGKELWRHELEQQHYASVIAVGDRIYFWGTQGKITVVAADRTFRMLAQHNLHGQIFATPAPVDGELFLRTRTYLFCFR